MKKPMKKKMSKDMDQKNEMQEHKKIMTVMLARSKKK